MIQIQRPSDQARFLAYLAEAEVPYDLNKYGQIYYPVSYRDKVQAATTKLWGPINNDTKSVSVRPIVAPHLAEALINADLPFEFSFIDDKAIFSWSVIYHESAMEVVGTVDLDAGT